MNNYEPLSVRAVKPVIALYGLRSFWRRRNRRFAYPNDNDRFRSIATELGRAEGVPDGTDRLSDAAQTRARAGIPPAAQRDLARAESRSHRGRYPRLLH